MTEKFSLRWEGPRRKLRMQAGKRGEIIRGQEAVMAILKEAIMPGATGVAEEGGAGIAEVMSPLRILGGESKLYTKPPAVEVGDNLVVLQRIEKRFYGFLRCLAVFSTKDVAGGDLTALDKGVSVSGFKDAVARVSPTAVLGPVEGGEPLVIYVARPGKEEDFGEILPDFQEEGRKRLAILKDEDGKPLAVVFGEEKWKEKWEQKPGAAGVYEAEGKAEARAKLLAFLEGDEEEGYKLPEGYEQIKLKPDESRRIKIDSAPGSEVVCYAGNVGVVLTRGKDGRMSLRLKGFDLSQSKVSSDNQGDSEAIKRENIGPKEILLGGRLKTIDISQGVDYLGVRVQGLKNRVLIELPGAVLIDGKVVEVNGLGLLGVDFELDGENIRVENKNFSWPVRLAVLPGTAETEIQAEQRELPEMNEIEREALEAFMSALSELADLEASDRIIAEITLLELRSRIIKSVILLHNDIHRAVYNEVARQLGREGKKLDIKVFSQDWLDVVVEAIRERRRK